MPVIRMSKNSGVLWAAVLIVVFGGTGWAETVRFTPRELYRISFGTNRENLGARVEKGNLIIPRTFTMDGAGHFYIDDANHHRIARYAADGTYDMEFRYPATATQVFAHADSRENLWLLISDPEKGMYYGVFDGHGKSLRSGVFSKFTHFRLHLDDAYTLHVILSSDKTPPVTQTYIMDEKTFLMKKENIAPPPENHHQVRKSDRLYFMDQVPGAAHDGAHSVTRITDETHRNVADIQGSVIYMTGLGDVYTQVGDREIRVYDVSGSLKGKVTLIGLPSACAAIRFDPTGNIFELDGIPDATGHYTADMPGMRLIEYERP